MTVTDAENSLAQQWCKCAKHYHKTMLTYNNECKDCTWFPSIRTEENTTYEQANDWVSDRDNITETLEMLH